MKLNLKELSHAFRKLKEEETVSSNGVNSYLLEKVLLPTLQGNAPMLKDIDYSQFEDDDISDLANYCESLMAESNRLMQFVGAVASIEAVPCCSRQFC